MHSNFFKFKSVLHDDNKNAEQLTSVKIRFTIARPSFLVKNAFKMKVIKRHCIEDKVEANYLF